MSAASATLGAMIMAQRGCEMPRCIPIKEIKNTTEFARIVEESPEPVIVTRNGREAFAAMSIELLDSLPKVDPQATVHIANSLWADEGFQLKGGFANVCREAYRAEACALDFGSAEAAAHVNRWCDEQTRHCIPRMADRLNPDARLLLLNALYFKNRWANVFSKRATRKEVFRALDGTAAPVDMMHRTADYGFAQSDYFDIARLPYGNGAFSMVVLLPSPQHTWQECVDALTAENWARWTASGMLLKKLDLKLPAFRMEVQTELNGSLQRLGMRRAFEPGQAELSAMADGDLCVSQVSQSAFLVVDEEGAEAAAATTNPLPPYCSEPEEVAAVTSARECERWGATELRRQLVSYLDERIVHCADSRLERVVNRNMFFCLFFSTGRTLDSEELVSVTSRSPEYYVSAAYWDRDSLLWAFPAICRADREKARELMLYVATRQRNNIGIHSRYIDGSILEPGFELDELVSPVLALDMYLRETGDHDLLSNGDVRCLIDLILSRLQRWYNVDYGLYETFLQPTDDMTGNCRMLTYDNVLVWKAFMILSDLDYGRKRNEFACKAENLREAIQKHCIISIDDCDEYVWAIDGKGDYEVYDEPPGSLLLLPVLGFCSRNDSVHMNTVARITDESYKYSFAGCPFSAIGCAHEPHPWTLSMANAVRASKDDDMVRKLCTAKMDDGIVCESIDEYTGECTSGKAFATAAGYVVYSLLCYLDEKKSEQDI